MSEIAIPTLEEFLSWSSEQVAPYLRDKVVEFSPGGSSRWYFAEYGEAQAGYSQAEVFADYAQRSFQRTLEIADLMFADGVQTLFMLGIMPGQFKRDEAYRKNLLQSLTLLANDAAQGLYDHYQMGVLFRGAWHEVFAPSAEATILQERCQALEERTKGRERWLIWLTREEVIPPTTLHFIAEQGNQGEMPPHETLCQHYYGRPLHQVDIFIGHNKPALSSQIPPLLGVGDVYFTVIPSYYLDRTKWRNILYDHLFARRGEQRDYTAMPAGTMDDLRAFYQANENIILGVGEHHAPSRTWRPSGLRGE